MKSLAKECVCEGRGASLLVRTTGSDVAVRERNYY